MIKVHPSLSERQIDDLKALAGDAGLSFAEQLRRVVDCYPPIRGRVLSGAEIREVKIFTSSGMVQG